MTATRLSSIRLPRLEPHTPILARQAEEWQVGVDPGRSILVRSAGLRSLVELFDGRHPMSLLSRRARSAGLTDRELRATIAALRAAGLLADAETDASDVRTTARVRLIGAGPLGRDIATLLVGHPVASLHVYDDEPPHPGLYPAGDQHPTRSMALCATLASRAGTRLTSVSHWTKPDGTALDLTIIARESAEIDRGLADHLMRQDHPHLVVRGHSRGVTVGPLVLPGQTSCLRCSDLTRRDADPHWPTVLAQLIRITAPVPASLVAWGAAVAAAQALAFLGGAHPECAGATLEMDTSDFAMRLRSWPAHPGCGCGWATITEWGT
ncbi:MAG TPA: hypothetical protein VIT20_11635 [Propionibacteriaceae bacterium]